MATRKTSSLALPDSATGPRSRESGLTKSFARHGGAMALNGAALSMEQIDLIKRTICRGSTDDELALFITVCNRTGLDPFSRQIHAVKRSGSMTIQTGIDGYRLIAQRTGTFAGSDDYEYDVEDQAHPNKATCTVYRIIGGQRVPITRSARWSEFATPNSPLWRKMPYLMLGKCAEAQALRAAFPQELSGLYTVEEMAQADNAAPATFVDVERPAAPEATEPEPEDVPFDAEPAAEAPPAEDNTADVEALMEPSLRGALGKALKDAHDFTPRTLGDARAFLSRLDKEALAALSAAIFQNGETK